MPSSVDTLRAVETPEGVDLGLRVAGPHARALAYLLDVLIRTAVLMGVLMVVSWIAGIGQVVASLSWFALEWLYPVVFEVYSSGATPGKRALGLAVVQVDGRPVGWSQSMLRNVLRAVDFLPLGYMAGLLSLLGSPDFQRLGDRVAGTVVIHVRNAERVRRSPDAAPLAPSTALSRVEQAAIVEFAWRRSAWSQERAMEVADHLEPLTGQRGAAGVARTLSIAAWIGGAR